MNRMSLIAAAAAACLASACQGQANGVPGDSAATDAAALASPLPDGSVPAPDAAPVDKPALVPAEDSPPTPDATKPPASADSLITTLVLNKGMTGDIGPNAALTFVKVLSDSRCPKNAQCIWAGEVSIALTIAVRSATEDFELSTHGSPSRTVKGYGVDLVSFAACPGGPAVTPLPGECATLKVAPAP